MKKTIKINIEKCKKCEWSRKLDGVIFCMTPGCLKESWKIKQTPSRQVINKDG